MTPPPLLRVEALEETSDGVVALVRCDPARLRTRDVAGLADRAWSALPLLSRHRCENPARASMREELADTEVAHLLEHVAVELLARGAPARAARGSTAWDFARDGRGIFRVAVRHPDPGAAKLAVELAAELVDTWAEGSAGDPRGAIEALHAAQGR